MTAMLSLPRDAAPFQRSPSSSSLAYDAYSPLRKNQYSLPDLRSPSVSSSRTSSLYSTPSSSLSLDTKSDESSSDDDGLSLPRCSSARHHTHDTSAVDAASSKPAASGVRQGAPPSPSPTDAFSSDTPLTTPDPLPMSEDDTAVRKEPSHHVDYLSYEWREEDIWSSWRHIVEHRNVYGERSRLENASWRTWAKAQFKLKTVSPETLNWLKDVDVTWLYGPMQPASNRFCSQQNSEPASRLSKTNSFVNGVKKPILKKRSMSEAMLQKSISSSSLVQQAAESVQAQRTTGVTLDMRRPRPIIGHVTPDFPTSSTMSRGQLSEGTDYFSSRCTSELHTPDHGERRHIRFDDKVEQCIAVECKDADDDEDDCNHNPWARDQDNDSSSDEGVVMMKRSRRKKPLSRTASTASISGDNKTIAKLPSTTLKYRTDSPDVPDTQQSHSLGFWKPCGLSPSPSSETLKPSNPSRNFLLAEDDDEDEDEFFDPSSTYCTKRPSTPTASDPYSFRRSESSASLANSGLRRTPSGMFMPFGDEDEEPLPPSLLGRVVDTVNTARDIGHVIWNAAWSN
ncbi:protein phosphatase regulator [Exserohilum turcicum]|uniref:Nitrogen regulatory protein areA GATA-like domain-containing protein n=1 Tax=Exserohilum turcicum (strain 28A) TaxID=671987 RepID=R0K7S3_EXST2|nr:uncharacterized protein SETTUDRAFT_168221 [Exserohilum turcica Et28A]EOA89023.1 hypothetical protein SETTUDRAFT_168221 [Exserohilum turcica Et28A]